MLGPLEVLDGAWQLDLGGVKRVARCAPPQREPGGVRQTADRRRLGRTAAEYGIVDAA
jgi:hypothetical protein